MNMIFHSEVIKNFKCLALYLCMAIILCGCTTNKIVSTPEQSSKAENYDIDNLNLKIVTHPSGLSMTVIGNNNNGAYETIINDDGSGQVVYFDFATKQKVYLSSDITQQKGEKSTGYIPQTLGGVMPIVTDKNLYIVKCGHNRVTPNDTTQIPSFILKMDLNGSNANKIELDMLNNIAVDSAFAYSELEQSIYYVEYTFEKEKHTFTNCSIVALNSDTKKAEKIKQFPAKDNIKIIGAFADNLVLMRVSDIENSLHEIIVFSTQTQEVKTICKISRRDKSFCIYGSTVYILDNATLKLESIDLNTQEKQEIKDFSNTYTSIWLYPTAYDGKLIFQGYPIEKSDKLEYFYYDLETVHIADINLYLEDNDDKMFVGIFGETNEDFLVYTGNKSVPVISKGTDGQPYQGKRIVMQYALIKKDDYWNSKPNYRFFEDNINY